MAMMGRNKGVAVNTLPSAGTRANACPTSIWLSGVGCDARYGYSCLTGNQQYPRPLSVPFGRAYCTPVGQLGSLSGSLLVLHQTLTQTSNQGWPAWHFDSLHGM